MTGTDIPAPAIGISARLSNGNADGADPRVGAANGIFDDVVDLITASGARPVLIEPGSPERVRAALDRCQGYVVPGGGDVDPGLYGGDPRHPALYDVNPAQDALDLTVIRHARAARLPLLGICRGMQLLNVVYGGTLDPDMAPTTVVHSRPFVGELEWARHEVSFAQDSVCSRAHAAPSALVASGHHQAVDRVGRGLRVTARAADGCVEGIESDDFWAVGVQWHPEAHVNAPADRTALFHALHTRATHPLRTEVA